MRLEIAQSYARHITEWLAPHCERLEIAGSIRRERPECGDVDLVCIPKLTQERDILGEIVHRRNHVHHHLVQHAAAGRCKIASGGDREGRLMIVQLQKCQLDVYFATPETFATILLCRTGSKEHNILIAQRALDLGGHWKPNEQLTIAGRAIASSFEQQIYDALKLPWIEPRDREGEFVAKLIRKGL